MCNSATEDQIFKPNADENWPPDKNQHIIETYVGPIKNALEKEGKNIKKNKHYSNLIKGERTVLKELADQSNIPLKKQIREEQQPLYTLKIM